MNLQQFIDEKQQRSAEWSEKKQTERTDLMEMLESSVMDITTIPESFKAFLDFQAGSGSRYSANNAALVLAQKPEATHIGTVEHWNKLGRKVEKGASGIRVMVPERYDYMRPVQQQNPENGAVSTTTERKRGLGFKMMSVFDITQTTGKQPPEPVRLNSAEKLEKGFKALVDISPVPLGVDNYMAVPAFYDSATMSISVNQQHPPEELFHALVSEIAHAELHDGGKYSAYTREECDFYAGSVAYLVSKRFGLNPPAASLAQVTGEFEGFGQEGRREVLEMLHEISKGMGERVAQELGVPVHQRMVHTRSNSTAR